ncbi:MAG: hypothetical protein QGI68_06355 [Pseudomonadales bacterium]|nr:hypothetical protein [Pseudomonadales bacterium]MDP7359218.1 hypothetical protein [Pseudomonadales bacterium]MDP7595175.1 hypothetical protein [Pseudomonadales bacterium]HJN50182.1 hypothetical protein [Pseudomonadales bacterium]
MHSGTTRPRETRRDFHAKKGRGSEPPENRNGLAGGVFFPTLQDLTVKHQGVDSIETILAKMA